MVEINILNQLPIHVFWKNKNLEYLGANDLFLNSAGVQSITEIQGKTDYDFSWRIFAEKYRADDEVILRNNTIENAREKHIDKNGNICFAIVTKKPLFSNEGQLIGLVGLYHKIAYEHDFNCTDRQKQILLCLCQGLTSKETAIKLNLSFRTVESYLDNLKSKLGCKNKAEMISMIHAKQLLAY